MILADTLTDAFSKWLEVAVVPLCSAASVTRFLRNIFATHGLPEQIASDNGMAFTSNEFKAQSIPKTELHSPHNQRPASNGLVERCVQMFKDLEAL